MSGMTNALIGCLLLNLGLLCTAPNAVDARLLHGAREISEAPSAAQRTLAQEAAEFNALHVRLAGEEGAIGNLDCVTGPEFAKLIAWAESNKISTLYVTIDSPGGSTAAKNQIVPELLRANARGLRTVAIVKRAEGTAALIAFACSEIFVLPGAPLGSKELPREARSELARKLLGEDLANKLLEQERTAPVLAATDTEAASRFARSAALLRSMYEGRGMWLGEDGKLTDVPPTDRNARPLFSERHAVSGGDLVRWGFAKEAADASAAIRSRDTVVPEKALVATVRRVTDGRRRAIATIEAALEDLDQIKRLGKSETKSTQASRDARRRKVESRLEEARAELMAAVTDR
jgi:hypothetical protein